jgi:hypothetical protein
MKRKIEMLIILTVKYTIESLLIENSEVGIHQIFKECRERGSYFCTEQIRLHKGFQDYQTSQILLQGPNKTIVLIRAAARAAANAYRLN